MKKKLETIKLFLALYNKLSLHVNLTKFAVRCGMKKHSYRVIARVIGEEEVRDATVNKIYDTLLPLFDSPDPLKEIKRIHVEIPEKVDFKDMFSCRFCKKYGKCTDKFPSCILRKRYESVVPPAVLSFLATTSRDYTQPDWR